METAALYLGKTDGELAAVDPLEMNLRVAQGIPRLANLDVIHYKRLADRWANEIKRCLSSYEKEFHKTPQDWDHDLHKFRLGVVCQFVHFDLGIRYKEEQKDVAKISYTDPSDLFLNGVMDTRRGTCGNMATLHVALGWRLGWPVSLAMAGWHCLLRFDNGQVVWNVEATNTEGGFRAPPDSFCQKEYRIPQEHIDCGSDLTFLKPRQLLGQFFGSRGRHWWDVQDIDRAERDFQTALTLYPQSRLYQRMVGDCRVWRPLLQACNTIGSWAELGGDSVQNAIDVAPDHKLWPMSHTIYVTA
jgi:hypothetical protein